MEYSPSFFSYTPIRSFSPIFPFHLSQTPDSYPPNLHQFSVLAHRSQNLANYGAFLPAILSLRVTHLPARLLRQILTLAPAPLLITNLPTLALLRIAPNTAVPPLRITHLPAITPLPHHLPALAIQLAIRAVLIAPRPALARLADQRAPARIALPQAAAQGDAHLGAGVVEPLVPGVLFVAVDERPRHADERAFVDVAAEAAAGWVVGEQGLWGALGWGPRRAGGRGRGCCRRRGRG